MVPRSALSIPITWVRKSVLKVRWTFHHPPFLRPGSSSYIYLYSIGEEINCGQTALADPHHPSTACPLLGSHLVSSSYNFWWKLGGEEATSPTVTATARRLSLKLERLTTGREPDSEAKTKGNTVERWRKRSPGDLVQLGLKLALPVAFFMPWANGCATTLPHQSVFFEPFWTDFVHGMERVLYQLRCFPLQVKEDLTNNSLNNRCLLSHITAALRQVVSGLSTQQNNMQ